MFTYVVKADSTVEARPLKVGDESGAVTVITDGLKEGEQVVLSNQYRLSPGARVHSVAAEPSPTRKRTLPADAGARSNGCQSRRPAREYLGDLSSSAR